MGTNSWCAQHEETSENTMFRKRDDVWLPKQCNWKRRCSRRLHVFWLMLRKNIFYFYFQRCSSLEKCGEEGVLTSCVLTCCAWKIPVVMPGGKLDIQVWISKQDLLWKYKLRPYQLVANKWSYERRKTIKIWENMGLFFSDVIFLKSQDRWSNNHIVFENYT